MDIIERDIKIKIATHVTSYLKCYDYSNFLIKQIRSGGVKEPNGNSYDYSLNLKILRRFKDIVIDDENKHCGVLYWSVNRVKMADIILTEVVSMKDKYGCDVDGTGKRVLVEFSSPNIAKPFHMGHLRSTMIGNFISNLHRMLNYEVVAINYLGDWGKQFGLLGFCFEQINAQLEEDPIRHLYQIYITANRAMEQETEQMKLSSLTNTPTSCAARQYFMGLERGDPQKIELWNKIRELSVKELTNMYSRLGIKFDIYSGESQVNGKWLNAVIEELENKSLLESEFDIDEEINGTRKLNDTRSLNESDGEDGLIVNNGARLVDLTEWDLGKALIIKSDGTSLYLTRDIAESARRWTMFNGWIDRSYYVVGDAQAHHFKQFFKILDLIKSPMAGRCQHIGFGLVKDMSTRSGTAIFLSDFLDQAKENMLKVMTDADKNKMDSIVNPEEIADQLGLSALVVWDFYRYRSSNYAYNWAKMTSFRGETGPYLQYAHARICNIIRKVENELSVNDAMMSICHLDLLVGDSVDPQISKCAWDLIYLVGSWPSVVKKCIEDLEPIHVISYLMDLAKAVSTCYKWIRVMGENNKNFASIKLLLYISAQIVLKSGLRLIGLTPLEIM